MCKMISKVVLNNSKQALIFQLGAFQIRISQPTPLKIFLFANPSTPPPEGMKRLKIVIVRKPTQ